MSADFVTVPLTTLRSMLSNCAQFQTWCGAVDATAALAFIHQHYIDAGTAIAALDDTTEGFALVGYEPGLTQEAIAGGVQTQFAPGGQLRIEFCRAVTAAEVAEDGTLRNWATTYDDTTDAVGLIVKQLMAQSGIAGNLAFSSIEIVEMPGLFPVDKRGQSAEQFIGMAVQATWGI